MKVYTRDQAKDLLHRNAIPVNSIGVCKCNSGWAYWYWDGEVFDSGVKNTEENALRTAKLNLNRQ